MRLPASKLLGFFFFLLGVAGTPAYAGTLVFGVPNAASSSFDVALR